MVNQPDTTQIADIVQAAAEESDAEVYLYFGGLDRPSDDTMMDACPEKPARPNALLLLETFGGGGGRGVPDDALPQDLPLERETAALD